MTRCRLTARNDEHWTSVCVHHGNRAQCQELANSHRLLGFLASEQSTLIKVPWEEEQVLVCIDVGVGQVSGWVVQPLHGRKTLNKVRETVHVQDRLDGKYCRGVAEAEGLVEIGLHKVSTSTEEAKERAVHREACQDDAVGYVWVHVDERICLRGPKGVARYIC